MSDEASLLCANCKRDIPSANYQMHVVHCQRNIQLCPKCEEPVPRSELAEHDVEFHSQVKCPECPMMLESSALDDHKTKDCPKRQTQCQYCELELKADTMDEHENYCGSRTESCEACSQLVMLRNQQMHVESGHRKIKPDDDVVELSSDEDEGVYARRSRRDARNRNVNGRNRPANYLRDVTSTYYPRRFDIDEELDDSFQNMELDHARNTATLGSHIPPRQNRPPAVTHNVDENDLVPCEFCNAPIAFDQLVLHQTGCRPDLVSSPTAAGQHETFHIPERRNGTSRPSILEDNITLIPCEFCHKPFNLDFFAIHQSACQNGRAVPAANRGFEFYESD